MASVNFPGLSALLEGLMGAAKVAQEANKIPEYRTILDAYGQIREMQRTIYDLDEKLRETEKQLKAVRDAQIATEGSRIVGHLLYLRDDSLPYCLHCYDSNKKLIHVVRRPTGTAECPECSYRVFAS